MRLPRLPALKRPSSLPLCRFYSSSRTIQENDVLFLRQHGEKAAKWHLTAPLRAGSRIKLSYGASVKASDLIGRCVLDAVPDSTGRKVILHEPSMATYIINSSRLATPIYPHDANTIVSMLDLNLPRPGEEEFDTSTDQKPPPFEIFEAGTGMGSLTLHLARAIHAANPAVSPSLRNSLSSAHYKANGEFGLDLSPEDQITYDDYHASRHAVLHTLDRNPKHSRGAHRLIHGFRRSLYLPSVDFHVGSIDKYISSRLAQTNNQPFLSHAVLDLPSAHDHAASVVQALHPNGLLVIFTPSISQIADFQAWAVRSDQPLNCERVIELAVSTTADGIRDSGGGKEWDIRTTMPKGQIDGAPVQVMRPKVGDRVVGGGFVAAMRRWPVKQMAGKSESSDEQVASELDGVIETAEQLPSDGPSENEVPSQKEYPTKSY
ncbi:hypothetical protein FDECE_12591 [Fusarium decemcellulare]|nr:hypothetical protein FDECE_12591 [Fusarium decemcellulare]